MRHRNQEVKVRTGSDPEKKQGKEGAGDILIKEKLPEEKPRNISDENVGGKKRKKQERLSGKSAESRRKKKDLSKKKEEGRKKKSGTLSTVILVFIFLLGIGIMLYPSVTSLISSREQAQSVLVYRSAVLEMDEEECAAIIAAAQAYNEELVTAGSSATINGIVTIEDYEETLDITGTGIMGYLTIEKIGVELPVYHGTSSGVLQIAAGHYEGTSLPVGGESTHCVLTGHRGLPTATLFTNLDQMEIGDTFTITVLNLVLTYEVDQILTVLPSETENLYIEEGEDYCTLMTCTPYGINTHRLLVRGKRIETEEEEEKTLIVVAEARRIDPLVVAPLAAAPMLFLLLIWLLIRRFRKARRAKRESAAADDVS